MNKILLIIFVLVLLNCNLIEPSTLIIQNESNYNIIVNLDKGNKSSLELKHNEYDFILVYPGDIKLNVNINALGISNEYKISINYLEKKKFVFSIHN